MRGLQWLMSMLILGPLPIFHLSRELSLSVATNVDPLLAIDWSMVFHVLKLVDLNDARDCWCACFTLEIILIISDSEVPQWMMMIAPDYVQITFNDGWSTVLPMMMCCKPKSILVKLILWWTIMFYVPSTIPIKSICLLTPTSMWKTSMKEMPFRSQLLHQLLSKHRPQSGLLQGTLNGILGAGEESTCVTISIIYLSSHFAKSWNTVCGFGQTP